MSRNEFNFTFYFVPIRKVLLIKFLSTISFSSIVIRKILNFHVRQEKGKAFLLRELNKLWFIDNMNFGRQFLQNRKSRTCIYFKVMISLKNPNLFTVD